MKYCKLIVFLSFILFFSGCGHKPPQNPSLILGNRPAGFSANKLAVVQVVHFYNHLAKDKDGKIIKDKDGKFTTSQTPTLGTGAVTDVNGEVMTNYHIVRDRPIKLDDNDEDSEIVPDILLSAPPPPDRYGVCLNNGNQLSYCYPAEIVKTDKALDLAILHVGYKFPQAVEFADNSTLVPGDEVYFWGNIFDIMPPSPFFGRFLGELGKPYYDGMNIGRLIMDITLVEGSSGSPVFNYAGKCIGMGMAYFPKKAGPRPLAIIIPSNQMMKFKKENPWRPQKK
jgi:S1-C subfamily serine protease